MWWSGSNTPHIVESQQFSRQDLEELLDLAVKLETEDDECLKGKIIVSLFYEPSTRTRFSFESAALRLGARGIITTENAKEFSSAAKGEGLSDTIQVIGNGGYGDIIVLRHTQNDAAEVAARASSISIVNAGCGPDKDNPQTAHLAQHPTQGWLDVFTIRQRRREVKKDIDGTRIAVIGDLKNSRTVRSLIYNLGKYEGIVVEGVSPPQRRVLPDIQDHLRKHGVRYCETDRIDDVLDADVFYMTRPQSERHNGEDVVSREEMERCRMTLERGKKISPHAIIMHPLPRTPEELPTEVDQLPQAVYLKEQVRNGLLVRMAGFKLLAEAR